MATLRTARRATERIPANDEGHRANGALPKTQKQNEQEDCGPGRVRDQEESKAPQQSLLTGPLGLGVRTVAGAGICPSRGSDHPNVMTSREIADLTGKRHDNVLRDARAMLTELHGDRGVLRFEATRRDPQNGQTYSMLALPKRECLILVSGYSLSMRTRIIDRWQELEAQVARPSAALLPDFTDPAASARAWAAQFEARQALALESARQAEALALAAPKVVFADAMVCAEGTLTIRDAAKAVGAPPRKLERLLRDKRIVLENKAPAAFYVERGYLKQSTFTYPTKTRGTQIGISTRVTGLGLEFLRRLVNKHCDSLFPKAACATRTTAGTGNAQGVLL